MQVTIDVKESAAEQVMYLLRNLSDVRVIASSSKESVLDDELDKRVEAYSTNTSTALDFDTNLKAIRDKVAAKG